MPDPTTDDFARFFAGRRSGPFNALSPSSLPQEDTTGMDVPHQQGFSLDDAGLGPAWRRFVLSGFYNGDFATAPPSASTNIDNTANLLPHWRVASLVGTSCTAKWLADATTASGGVIRITTTSPSAVNDAIAIEQIVPINSTRGTFWNYMVTTTIVSQAFTGTINMTVVVDWLKSDAVTTTGTGFTQTTAIAGIGNNVLLVVPAANQYPPTDAYYARVRIGIKVGSVNATVTADISDAILTPCAGVVGLTESLFPATKAPGYVAQFGGAVYLVPVSDVTKVMAWDGATLTLGGSGGSIALGGNAFTSTTGRVLSSGDFESGGIIITKNKNGTPVDGDFSSSARNGGLTVDSSANKIWGRTSGGWKGVAIAGFSIPRDEPCARCGRSWMPGQDMVLHFDHRYLDGGVHAFAAHRSCGWRYRLKRLFGLEYDHTQELCAALANADAEAAS